MLVTDPRPARASSDRITFHFAQPPRVTSLAVTGRIAREIPLAGSTLSLEPQTIYSLVERSQE